MSKRALMIVPTRDRPDSINEIWKDWNSPATDLMIGVDDDQIGLYLQKLDLPDKHPSGATLILEINPRLGMNGTLNLLATKYCYEQSAYGYVGFMGDDHRPRTSQWGELMMDRIGPLGIAYGDDGHQGAALPTAVMMSANIVQTLGYMAPPELTHLYLDNSWVQWGQAIDRLFYMPNLSIEHMHPAAGKSEWDDGYERVNSEGMYNHDLQAFDKYMREQFETDMEKLRGIQAV